MEKRILRAQDYLMVIERKSFLNLSDLSAKKNLKSLVDTGKDILEDEEIKKIHAHVKNTMFKGTSNT